MFTSNVSLLKHNNIIKVVLPPQKIFGTTTRFTDFSEHVSSPQTTVLCCYENYIITLQKLHLQLDSHSFNHTMKFLGNNRTCKLRSDHLYAYFQNNIAM